MKFHRIPFLVMSLFLLVACASDLSDTSEIQRRDFSEMFKTTQDFYSKYSEIVSNSELAEALVEETVEKCVKHFLGNPPNLLSGWARDDYFMELNHIRKNRNAYVFVFEVNFHDVRVAYEGRQRNGEIVLTQYYHIPHF